MSADNSPSVEPRIGYNMLQMANQGLGLQGTTEGPAAYGYLDYFDYTDLNTNSHNYAKAGSQYYGANLLRRRNGQLNAAALAGLGVTGQRLKAAEPVSLASSGYGQTGYGHSGYGGGGYAGPVSVVSGYGPSQQCYQGINPLLALLTLAGAAIGFYFIYIKLTMSGGRSLKADGGALENIAEMLWIGKNYIAWIVKLWGMTK